jgi:hypothetical protein
MLLCEARWGCRNLSNLMGCPGLSGLERRLIQVPPIVNNTADASARAMVGPAGFNAGALLAAAQLAVRYGRV